jgi:hypothetical protein
MAAKAPSVSGVKNSPGRAGTSGILVGAGCDVVGMGLLVEVFDFLENKKTEQKNLFGLALCFWIFFLNRKRPSLKDQASVMFNRLGHFKAIGGNSIHHVVGGVSRKSAPLSRAF